MKKWVSLIYSKKYLLYQCLIILIFFQIIMGAFVSGLDAGMIYQTWPLMGDTYLPNDTLLINFESYIDFNNQSLIQFYHRNLAYLIIFITGVQKYKFLEPMEQFIILFWGYLFFVGIGKSSTGADLEASFPSFLILALLLRIFSEVVFLVPVS